MSDPEEAEDQELPPAACELLDAETPAEPTELPLPSFEPHIKTEGHQKICQIVLPVLCCVLRDSVWCTRGPRDQVREALDRNMP